MREGGREGREVGGRDGWRKRDDDKLEMESEMRHMILGI